MSPPVCASSALASGGSLPADLAGVSVEPLKASSVGCPTDDLDVTLGALARQLASSSAVVPRGGEGYPPPPRFVEPENEERQGTSEGTSGEFRKSSPRFTGFLPGFGQAFGAQGSSPVLKRGKYAVCFVVVISSCLLVV